MLKRIHIKGYKSLSDIEVKLKPLTVLFGPNAAGKSNLLDALQLLSKLGTSRTIKEAFDPSLSRQTTRIFHHRREGDQRAAQREEIIVFLRSRPALVERGRRGLSIDRYEKCVVQAVKMEPQRGVSFLYLYVKGTCVTAFRSKCCPNREFSGWQTSIWLP